MTLHDNIHMNEHDVMLDNISLRAIIAELQNDIVKLKNTIVEIKNNDNKNGN